MKAALLNAQGHMRTGWLLAVSLFGYALVIVAARWGLARALSALFQAWGIDADTVGRAPGWAAAIYAGQGSLVALAAAILTLLLAALLRRLWQLNGGERPPVRPLGRCALIGCGLALTVAALSLIPDSSRLYWPLTAPRVSLALLMLAAVSLLSALAGEALSKRALYDGLKARWGRAWAALVVCLAYAVSNGVFGGSVVSAINALALGAVGCALYEREGLWASVGFRWGFNAACALLLGFGGAGASVFRLYGVSEVLLTGGDGGPMYGLWTTILLIGATIVIKRREVRKTAHRMKAAFEKKGR